MKERIGLKDYAVTVKLMASGWLVLLEMVVRSFRGTKVGRVCSEEGEKEWNRILGQVFCPLSIILNMCNGRNPLKFICIVPQRRAEYHRNFG